MYTSKSTNIQMGVCRWIKEIVSFLREENAMVAFGLDPQYDIDKIKLQCETYKEEMKEGEQKSLWER